MTDAGPYETELRKGISIPRRWREKKAKPIRTTFHDTVMRLLNAGRSEKYIASFLKRPLEEVMEAINMK